MMKHTISVRKGGRMARGDQLARQWKIFQTLVNSRYGKSVAALAEELDCHQRTVYRDLDALEAAGFPIYTEFENGRNLWRIVDSARTPLPVPFSLPELMALYFGSDALRALEGTVFYDSLASVLKKIESSIPPEAGAYLRQVEKSFHARPGPHKAYATHRKIIEQINDALLNNRVIEIVYYTLSRRKKTRRRVAPYRVWYHNGGIYVIGHCRWRNDIRIFALDRIRMVHQTDEAFEAPEEFDADEFMRSSFGVCQGEPRAVKILFHADIAEFIRERVWHESQRLSENPDGSLVFEARVACSDEFKAWVMRWGGKAVVLAPGELRESIRSEASEMLAVYADDVKKVKKAVTV
jgi:predicted DNA-binding transcriptional regulator YafY